MRIARNEPNIAAHTQHRQEGTWATTGDLAMKDLSAINGGGLTVCGPAATMRREEEKEEETQGPVGLGGPLYSMDQVPEHFHELFIHHGYRNPCSTARQCVLSLFDATNETLNFWTHFLPSWYFLWVTKGLAEQMDFRHDAYTWPLLCYMFACCIFPLASAVAHTFNTMSTKARHICFFLDYSALSMFSFGVANAYHAYVFPQSLHGTAYAEWFKFFAGINAVLCTAASCETRFMRPTMLRKVLRVLAFAWPYIFDSFPIVMRLMYCQGDDCNLAGNFHHRRQFYLAFVAAFLYTTHLPERLGPGKFDIVGHSHQLFHVASIFAVLDQMQAILLDMQERKASLPPVSPHLADSIGAMSFILVVNAIIIGLFMLRLAYINKEDMKKCD